MILPRLLFPLIAAPVFAGSATLFSDLQGNPMAAGSGTVVFGSYNAVSITITVSAYAYGASQQGGGRNYSGAASAAIGSSVQRDDVPVGSDPMSVNASNSLTVNRAADGGWYANGLNLGSSIAVSAAAHVDGENFQGGAYVVASVSWVEAPANSAPTISWISAPSSAVSGAPYTVTAHGHDADGNLSQVNVWKNSQPFAFAGGGNGTDGDSGNTTVDSYPQSVTFTAQAIDAQGAASALISQIVTITAPPNRAPSIAWSSAPSSAGYQQSYFVSAVGSDPDGNLARVNVWKNGVPFAFADGGNGFSGSSGNASSDGGPQTITYTAQAFDADGVGSGIISQTVTIGPPPNAAPLIQWLLAPTSVSSGQSYVVSARATDTDGNLYAVSLSRDGAVIANAGTGSGSVSDVSVTVADTGPLTVTFSAVARDAMGASSAVITQVVSVGAPPPVQYTLSTSSGPGGGVSPGGSFIGGSTALVSASADSIHDFAGWSGDASGLANPVSVTIDRSKSVQANFSLKSFPLTTAASTGGSVTGGGVYPYGTTVTLSSMPLAGYRFTGWTGDASGSISSVAVQMTAARSVQALFAAKTAQVISFGPLSDQSPGAGSVSLTASASSGLPVTFAVISGPASVSGSQLAVTGVGQIVVEARQAGNDLFLPAPAVAQSFNSLAAAAIKYRSASPTLLQGESVRGAAPLVIGAP